MAEETKSVFKSWFPLLFGLVNGVIFLLISPSHLEGLFVINGWFFILPLCVAASAIMLIVAIKWRNSTSSKVWGNVGVVVLALLLLVEIPIVIIAYT